MQVSEAAQIFHFRAGAPDGGVLDGTLLAGSRDEALGRLKQRGFVPLRIAVKPLRKNWLQAEIGLGRHDRLSLAECEAFCRELGLLLSAGVTASDSLELMTQSEKKGSRSGRFVTRLRRQLRLGGTLTTAIGAAGFQLPNDFTPVIRAGEEAGALGPALGMLAESYGEAHRFSRAYSAALAYPALLLVVATLVLALLAFFVAPSLSGLFVGSDKPVPGVIAVLTGFSSAVSANPASIVIGLASVVLVVVACFATPGIRRGLHSACHRLPVVGPVLSWSASRRFAGTLRLYLINTVPMASALPNAIIAAGFPAGEVRGRRLAERLRTGAPLTASLSEAKLMPARLLHMVAIGENSGRLPEMLAAVTAEAQRRFEQRMSLVSALLAPSLILLVGGLVGSVIFAVFSALLELNEVAF